MKTFIRTLLILPLPLLTLVPPLAQPAAPLYTPPDYHAVLAGKAPLRILLLSGQTMLAWKSGSGIRVINLVDNSVMYTCTVGEMVGIARETADKSAALRKDGKNFRVAPGVIRLESDKPIQLWTPGSNIWSGYPGPLIVTPTADGKFSVAREMLLEDYLRNVVPAEMPARFHPQALRAQAIIALTYTLRELGRHADEGADLCGTVHCQAYAGDTRRSEATDEAVSATKGLVLLYGDEPADAFYHSCCGGVTDDACLIWGPEYARPYLTGSADFEGKIPAEGFDIKAVLAKTDPYCKGANGLHWTRQFSAGEVNALVSKNLAQVAGDPAAKISTVTNLTIEERTPAGRAARLRVEGDGASVLVYGDQIRWLFGNGLPGPAGLWSTLFDMTIARDASGKISGYTFTGAGHGHGLGLCQWGAQGRAQVGQSYREILKAYYPGTRLSEK